MLKPDLNAPRFRPKVLNLMNQQLFERFRLKHPTIDITYEQFQTIVETYNGNTWETVVKERDGAELPEGLGNMFVGACPRSRKRRNVDFKKSAELGTIVSHKNWESNNKLGKIFYSNYSSRYRFRGRELWSFQAVRQFKRAASQNFRKNWTIYVPVENIRNIARIFKSAMKRESAKKAHENFDYTGYKEFDMT